jgi:hypothetical protein
MVTGIAAREATVRQGVVRGVVAQDVHQSRPSCGR